MDKNSYKQHYDLCNNCIKQVYNVIVNYLNRELPDMNIWEMKESNLDILKYINNKNIRNLFVFDMVIDEIKCRIVSLKRRD
jgi:NADPH-dependent 7-cyano-7-deazaguanine reductase QueF